ncbi:MAG: DNA-3-methyladenine glycosylase family protein [Nitrospiraceae bacterium]
MGLLQDIPVRPAKRRTIQVTNDHQVACGHLAGSDPVMRGLIARVGACNLSPRRSYFLTLCDSIISQQLSVRAAATIFNRFVALYPHHRPTPHTVALTSVQSLRGVGLSAQKAGYLQDLAAGFCDKLITPRRFTSQSNEEIIASLIAIRGIGRWTAEMFLIFALNRLDVLPVDDLGIRKAVQQSYALKSLPTGTQLRSIGENWRPYQTIASWYLWQSLQK